MFTKYPGNVFYNPKQDSLKMMFSGVGWGTVDLDPYNLKLHYFLNLGKIVLLFAVLCPLYQPCKTLQMVRVAPEVVCVREWDRC